ncbi:MAG: GlsB/YeaQ/YmgE family stress response membrane protein [Kofleriaceae bacterium]|jgi:uncharacterized membrane protein YeaQ/YmgE (transglycosylase-associated protein family)|nr:GlsB/YeaQ/YmgE family stress response membrane protein [Kofleriaceae bacterium]MBP9203099.1 GlsB/YeaQ/YmgE family stress response membrane protein [Kofleriaceae bacterium]
MGFIYALIIGLVIGAIAKLLMPGRDGGNVLVTALVGIGGSMLAFLVGRAAGWYGDVGDGPGMLASVAGAMLVLAGYRAILGKRTA